MKEIKITTLDGFAIDGLVIKEYDEGYLVFSQERICWVNVEYKVTKVVDILPFIQS